MHIGLNAHLLSMEAGYRSAGIHQVIDHLLRHLPEVAPEDWQFTAMVGSQNTSTYAHIRMLRSNLNTESPSKRVLWEQVYQPRLLKDFDLYHAMAFVGPLILKKPMVVTVYDLSFLRYPDRLSAARRLYLRMFTRLSCKRARRITAISHSTGHDLTRLMGIPAGKIDVTPLGYDSNHYKPLPKEEVEAFRRKRGLPERFWFFLGTLEPRKNLITLIRAYAALPRNERLPLIIAGGKGWLFDETLHIVDELGLNEEIMFPGFLPTDETPLWYNSAEVFVYPSVFEGFGLPVLEAMACGTPVITSDVSSLPEVAGKAGQCLPPGDIPMWTEALYHAMTDADWRRQAREIGLTEAGKFNWETTAQLTLESYRRALSLENV